MENSTIDEWLGSSRKRSSAYFLGTSDEEKREASLVYEDVSSKTSILIKLFGAQTVWFLNKCSYNELYILLYVMTMNSGFQSYLGLKMRPNLNLSGHILLTFWFMKVISCNNYKQKSVSSNGSTNRTCLYSLKKVKWA